jgi:hypothetical protein
VISAHANLVQLEVGLPNLSGAPTPTTYKVGVGTYDIRRSPLQMLLNEIGHMLGMFVIIVTHDIFVISTCFPFLGCVLLQLTGTCPPEFRGVDNQGHRTMP